MLVVSSTLIVLPYELAFLPIVITVVLHVHRFSNSPYRLCSDFNIPIVL